MKQLIKQTLAQLRTQKMLTTIGIIGTALSIFLIMVVVMLHQVQVAPYAPVSNRPRMLHAQWASVHMIENHYYQSNGPISTESAKRQFGSLSTPEAVTLYSANITPVNIKEAGGTPIGTDMRGTDENYWKIFDFTFLNGKPYSQADVESAHQIAVIDASTARKLFGTTEATGREFQLDYVPYTVCGVVRDVSTLADGAFSHIWIPHTTTQEETWCYGLMGDKSVTILARSSDDFDEIRAEYERMVAEYNKEVAETGWEFKTLNRPYTQEKSVAGGGANMEPDEKAQRRQRWIIYAILLIVPAINLSGMTESRMRRRVEEICVRRAFGCTRLQLLGQLFGENLLITLVAGLIGWMMGVAFAFFFSNFLFADGYSNTTTEPLVDINMLIQPSTLGMALLFCFVLNLLSSGLPAWKASRTNIVNAINKH